VTNILVLNSSASGAASVSNILVEAAVQHLLEVRPHASVTRRDLDADPVPHLTATTLAGVRGVAQTDAERGALARSDELIAELQAADTIVIGAPMYNFSIPTTLRAWFDHVLRPRVTFTYTEAGPQGLLSGKKVIVIESRGGVYSEGPAQALDFQEPYIRILLSFMGLTDVTFVHAEKIGLGSDARGASIGEAKGKIALAVAQPLFEAT
jgi:FMN-dependent NADH-azoreductase